jgi:hypothetical protein
MIHPSKIQIVDDDPFAVDYLEPEDLGYTTVTPATGARRWKKSPWRHPTSS